VAEKYSGYLALSPEKTTCPTLSFLLKKILYIVKSPENPSIPLKFLQNLSPHTEQKSSKMIVTDSNKLEAGVIDFVYVCRKQPFAVTCSPYLPKTPDNYVDLDLVLKMNIPIKNIQCTRQNYAGQNIRIVGQISQTIQCVVAGKALGAAHLKAKVVRDLSRLFHADCVAGQQLYDKLLDPSSLNTSKGVKNKSNKGISTTSKQLSGTTDIYTNVSAVIDNDKCDDDTLEDSTCDASYDDELTQYLAMMPDDARAQAVEDYPELARCIKQTVDRNKNTSQEDDLLQFFALQTKDYRAQAEEDYPELKTILQSEKSLSQPSSSDPVLAAIARQGIGPTDAYIMAINVNPQSHTISSMPATDHMIRQPMVDTIPSDLSYHSTSASDLRNDPTQEVSDESLPHLMTQHGYPDDLDSLQASHGYCDSGHLPDPDQVSLHSDNAEYFCRLCQQSDQPDIITFNHDLLDPSCPSMEYDDSFEEED
jgi:hypothetical protein